MVFEYASQTIIFALLGCAYVFAYLGISLGQEGTQSQRNAQRHFPMKLFFIMLALFTLTASVGMSAIITQSQCGQCGNALYCPDAVCTEYEQYVVNYTYSIFICLMISTLFVTGYFIVLFINWIMHFMNARKSKKAWLEEDYTRGRGSGDGSETQ